VNGKRKGIPGGFRAASVPVPSSLPSFGQIRPEIKVTSGDKLNYANTQLGPLVVKTACCWFFTLTGFCYIDQWQWEDVVDRVPECDSWLNVSPLSKAPLFLSLPLPSLC